MAYLPQDLHSPEEVYAWKRDVVLLRECVWIAEQDGRMLGYAAVKDGLLNHLYVRPDCQGQGIGSALLARAKAHAPAGLKLWTFEPDAGAIRFYQRHGFVTLERTDGRNNEERVPDRLMAWQPEPP